ncbi:hypothetical protein [Nocardia thailandica]|uniref:hypothetical protein n=1 Tax=Nocardia thailandica TaxID=257275 RepID=UPI000315FB44|nr:hypothetical protein [Nocardia thailandica]
MSGNGFDRYLTDDHKTTHRSEDAAQRRARIREAIAAGTAEYDRDGQVLDPAGTERGTPRPRRDTGEGRTEDTPPSTRRLTADGSHQGEQTNPNGFGKHISGDAPAGPSDAAQREADSPTAGRGFGRFLRN